MTTTIALPTRNCIALGCDSLATRSRDLVPFADLLFRLVDENGQPRIGADGRPVVITPQELIDLRESVPYDQIPTVKKLFALPPHRIGLLFAGLASIDSKTIPNLVSEFKGSHEYQVLGEYPSVEDVASALADYLTRLFRAAGEQSAIEVIVAGYSSGFREPEIHKILLTESDCSVTAESPRGSFDMVFGGQSDVIQRVVNGMDLRSFIGIRGCIERALVTYQAKLQAHFSGVLPGVTVPPYTDFVTDDLKELYGGFIPVSGTFTLIEQFSEQAAIDFVEFLVELMIKSQQFSNRLPTVGGDVHVAIITPNKGFLWISKEEYKFRGVGIPREE